MLETDPREPSPFGTWGGEPKEMGAPHEPQAKASNPRDEIVRQAKVYGVPPAVALQAAHSASRLRQPARKGDGRAGLFMLPEDVAQKLNVDATDWRDNARGGVVYLRHLHDEHGSWTSALKAGGYMRGKLRPVDEYPRGDPGTMHLSAPTPGSPTFLADFGPRRSSEGGDFHTGVDIAAPAGSPVAALTGGRVLFSGDALGAGNAVVIQDPGGRSWAYAHLGVSPGVPVGSRVRPGDLLGNVGSSGVATGNHLHLGVIMRGRWVNPVGIAQRAYGAGWGQRKRVAVADTDFNPPGHGGPTVGGVGQAETPDPLTGTPSTTETWRQILSTGEPSPEAVHIAQRQGVA